MLESVSSRKNISDLRYVYNENRFLDTFRGHNIRPTCGDATSLIGLMKLHVSFG